MGKDSMVLTRGGYLWAGSGFRFILGSGPDLKTMPVQYLNWAWLNVKKPEGSPDRPGLIDCRGIGGDSCQAVTAHDGPGLDMPQFGPTGP